MSVPEGGLNIRNLRLESLPPTEPQEGEEDPLPSPPPLPPKDPWAIDIRPSPRVDGDPVSPSIVRRPAESTDDLDTTSPKDSETRPNPISPAGRRRLDDGVTMMMEEEEKQRKKGAAMEPAFDGTNIGTQSEALFGETPTGSRGRSWTFESIVSNQTMTTQEPEYPGSATILPPGPYQAPLSESPASREVWQDVNSRVYSGHRSSTQSIPENPDAITGIDRVDSNAASSPPIAANFPPGIEGGLEVVRMPQNDREGMILAEEGSSSGSTYSGRRWSSGVQRCYTLSLNSSFFLYKGFCEGAKETARGGTGTKKVKQPVSGVLLPVMGSRC